MFEALKDLTHEQFSKGLRAFCLLHKEIYPGTNLIATIREYALFDASEPTAEDGWGEVVREKTRAFIYAERQFSDPLAEKTVQMMGWRNLCLSENEEADRAHFFKIYNSLKERERKLRILGKTLVEEPKKTKPAQLSEPFPTLEEREAAKAKSQSFIDDLKKKWGQSDRNN